MKATPVPCSVSVPALSPGCSASAVAQCKHLWWETLDSDMSSEAFLGSSQLKPGERIGLENLVKSLEVLLANAECYVKCDLKMVKNKSKGPLEGSVTFN